jgi:hypothetical protein
LRLTEDSDQALVFRSFDLTDFEAGESVLSTLTFRFEGRTLIREEIYENAGKQETTILKFERTKTLASD